MNHIRRDRWAGHHISELTLGGLLRRRASEFPSRPFLKFLPDGRILTYRDIDVQSNRIANGLSAIGVGRGSHVAVMMVNSPEQLIVYFAIAKLGAVSVPLNVGAKGALLAYYLDHSDATVLITDGEFLSQFSAVAEDTSRVATVVINTQTSTFDLLYGQAQEFIRYTDLESASECVPEEAASFKDTAFINYTSGTTGPSKGVVLTHAQALLWGVSHATAFGHRSTDIVYVCLPMFHVNALQGAILNALIVNATVVLQRRFSASGFWPDIRSSRATVTNLLGSMTNILWNRPPSVGDADNCLRMVMTVPIPSFAREFEERFGIRFTSGYSLTDYGPSHAYTLSDSECKLGSAGRVRSGMEAKVVDEDDFEVPPGEAGELLIRSSVPWHASTGYYKMDFLTLESRRNGWFHTGDRCRIDEDGYMWFVSRLKDVIRRKGENISAFELEQILVRHDAIEEIAAFAVPSEMSEDEIAVAVVRQERSTFDEVAFLEFCENVLPNYMVPRFIRFIDEIPRTSNQKVEKYKIAADFRENRTAYWDARAVVGR